MNKPLTAEEAKNLTFPCLLEVWDNDRLASPPLFSIVTGFEENGYLSDGSSWHNAALPSPEIAEAMRNQFGTPSEYPKRMLVWDSDEGQALERIVLADLGENSSRRYYGIPDNQEDNYFNGKKFTPIYWNHAKPLPEPDPISQEIAELRQRLADLEAKHSQQS